jgi:hypothetical protein
MNAGLKQRQVVRVLFDETHSESWTIDPAQAERINPDYPENSSYAQAAAVLAARDFRLARHTSGPLDATALAGADLVALLHPCDARWERTSPGSTPRFADEEIAALQEFVRGGGSLLVVTEYEHAKYGDNLNDLLAPFGLEILNTTVIDRAHCLHTNPAWVVGSAAADFPVLAHRVDRACFYQSGACRVVPAEGAQARIAWHASPQARPPGAGLIGVSRCGQGRVAVITDSLLFGDEFFGELEHCALWLNLCYWLAVPAFARSGVRVLQSAPAQSAGWLALKDQVNALRELQLPDGSIAEAPARSQATVLAGEILASLAALRPAFGHQSEYFDQLELDLRGWLEADCPKPNFSRSLAAFTPEKHRTDALESLVLFPMYTPNNSLQTKFEALIMRVPWPGWLDQLEATLYRNDKFVPGHLVDFTKGYASDCAVLFPETVSVAGGKSANHFGVIFCDREAARLQSYTQRAAAIVGLALHPQLECFLAGLPIMRDTAALWDLIHDRSHSLGELPFDPFMIRQRAPFWMYSLEELRVDLRTFYEAGRLAKEGFPFAHYVSYAILFDRIFRFPVVGTRVKNYDGLGGQLLFSYLHQKDALIWCDNHLTVNWELLPMCVNGLREEIQTLYRRGADCSKVSFWLDAHDLIAAYVKPNVASRWKRDTREIIDEADPKKWIGLVHDDEFPLGNFHVNLQRKLAQTPG